MNTIEACKVLNDQINEMTSKILAGEMDERTSRAASYAMGRSVSMMLLQLKAAQLEGRGVTLPEALTKKK